MQVRHEVHRRGAVAKAVEQGLDAGVAAHRQGDIDQVDPVLAHVVGGLRHTPEQRLGVRQAKALGAAVVEEAAKLDAAFLGILQSPAQGQRDSRQRHRDRRATPGATHCQQDRADRRVIQDHHHRCGQQPQLGQLRGELLDGAGGHADHDQQAGHRHPGADDACHQGPVATAPPGLALGHVAEQ